METHYMKIAPSLKEKRVKIPHVQEICSLSSLAEEKNKKMVRRNEVIEMCGSGKHFLFPCEHCILQRWAEFESRNSRKSHDKI
jgi:hypothetical protein